jgi:hypothetical protein
MILMSIFLAQPPDEFRETMLERIQDRVGELQKLVKRVMNGLLAVANLPQNILNFIVQNFNIKINLN